MENLDKLTATGLPIVDLNAESLDRTDWSQTSLGPRDSWPAALTVLVNSCLLPVPHSSAIFWGHDLSIVYNLAWAQASGTLDGQGASAASSYSGEALGSLQAAVRGRTVKVACKFLLQNTDDIDPGSIILLSTILDEKGSRQGVLAQLLHHSTMDRYLPMSSIDNLVEQNEAHETNHSASQQPNSNAKSEQADSVQTQLFQKFAELLPNGLAILDDNAEAVFVNDAFFKLTTNKTSKEFRAWPESIHPSDYDRVMSQYREAFSSREELRVEFRCTGAATGEEGEWRLFLLKPLSRHPEAGFICAVVDITEIKQAQLTQEKAATEARERKEQQERFIDMVSHEIRNPLSAVLHLAEEVKEIAREVQNTHPDQSKLIADILDAANTILVCVSHQNTLVDDILSFSKLDSMMLSLVPREVRPKWEFSQALKVFNSEFKAKHISFHYAMDVSFDEMGVDYVVADLNRMKQVLVNLITNAIKFTARKKGDRKITVSLGASEARPTSYPPSLVFFGDDQEAFHIDATVKAKWGTGATLYLMVAVKDTGIGISQENQFKLFERFRQATPKTQENYGGSGLGLFISRKLCQLHGGDIGVSSKDGEGSTFGFFFKVRCSDGSSEDGRPPFSSRTPSESSTAPQRSQTPRPSFGRSKSYLTNIEEGTGEGRKDRPKLTTLTSRKGVDSDDVNESLKNPPTEHRAEAHPGSSQDVRYRESNDLAIRVNKQRSSMVGGVEGELPDLKKGETQRQSDSAEDISKAQSRDPSPTHPSVLLVEDNLINQKVLRRQLQTRGFEVFVANNGQEAVDAVEDRGRLAKDDSSRANFFDCILMDQEMPIKDGNTATAEIRELQQQGKAGRSPILGVTANVRQEQTDAMLGAGMDAIISKPFKVDDLTSKIRALLPNG